MSIYMLDLDAKQAAQWHTDAHLLVAFEFAIQQLANAWHELYSNWGVPPFEKELPHDLVKRHVSDSTHPRPTVPPRTFSVDGLLKPGDRPVWTLMGQRIPQKHNESHASGLWVRELGGNYRWTWRFAAALVSEMAARNLTVGGKLLRALWTLEALPLPLTGTENDWSEAPVVTPRMFRVTVDGFYDAPLSWQLYYGSRHLPGSYYKNKAPPWLEEASERARAIIQDATI